MAETMIETELEIIRLKWHVSILQWLLVKFCVAHFSVLMGKPLQELLQVVLDQLDLTLAQHEPLLLSSVVPEDRRVLLADEFAQVVENMKTSITSMITNLTIS